MHRVIYILLLVSSNLFASDLGITGLIDIPSARMGNDGTLKVSFSNQDTGNITNLTYQATPWLETTFRYSYGPAYKDRSYAAKVLLLNERDFRPSIAIGIQDLIGTGIWSSEYIVASKRINDIDISLGLGWGRLAQKNTIKNPLIQLSDSFLSRDNIKASGGALGGKLRNTSFFRGSKAGVFGGIKYSIPNSNLKLIAEYNTDTYKREIRFGAIPDSSPLSYGIEWEGKSGLNLSLSHQHGSQLGFSFSGMFDTKSLPKKKEIEPFYSSYEDNFLNASGKPVKFDSWYDKLLYDAEQSGLILRAAKIMPDDKVMIEFSNLRYNMAADAINRMLTLSQIHLPRSINNIDLILIEDGYQVMNIRYIRSKSNNNIMMNQNYSYLDILKSEGIKNPSNITKFKVPHTNLTANLAAKFQLFDPDNPLKHQVYLKINTVSKISQTWNLVGSFAIDIDNSFNIRRKSNSVLPRVRTEINKYLVEGSSGMESLYLEKKSTLNDKIHYRAYLGVLETMYSGYGVEVLYQPFMSRLAIGGTINRVYKRNYKRDFKLLNYNTTSSFLSLFYASPFYNYDLALHLGRYLAKDKGATFEIRRTFDNGFSLGAFATFTDVSASDFGEGSFDKGLFLKIPFNSFSVNNTKNSFSTIIRSLQRDGGQKMDDFTGRLWFDMRMVRYDSFNNNKDRMKIK